MIAAFFVVSHQMMVQFCCKGVTGTMVTPIGGGDWLMPDR
jgi:hypothetical protein